MFFPLNSVMQLGSDLVKSLSDDQLQEAGRQYTARQNLIKSNFANIYNNNNLTTQQKAQQINQFAQQNNISRDEIASAMNLGANDLNAFLDTDPAVVQNRVNNLLQIATTEIKYNDPRYTKYTSDGWILNEAGLQFQKDQQDAWRGLEALGYEPVSIYYGTPVTWTLSPEEAAMVKWLSPQEAANVTGTKINNQLRNQAYIQSTDYLSSQLSPLANQLRQSLDAVNSSGGMLKSDPAYFYNKIAEELTSKTGITNLDDIGYRKLDVTPIQWTDGATGALETAYIRKDNGQMVSTDGEYFNKKTGQALPNGVLPHFKYGNRDNETLAYFTLGPNGKLNLKSEYAYEGEAWKDVVTALAPIALNFIPGVGQVLGAAILPAGTSAAIQTAVGNAVLKAGIDVATGVPVETALKNGLVSVGINQGLPNLSGNAYIDNAVKAVSVAALTGGDVEAALVNSVISTGGKEALGNVSLTGDKVVDSAIASAVTSGLSAAATGGDVGASVAQGFGSGLSAGINTQNQVTTIPGVPAQTITGAAGNDSIPAVGNDVLTKTDGLLPGGLGTTPDVGMDTVGNAAQDDVLGIVAQEQADIRAQTASQAMQGAKQITATEAAARELYPLTERYQGPNGTIYVRDINTGKITQLLPTGEASAITGGGVFLDRPDVIGAVEALPANAVYQGILYANDPKLIGKQLTADDLENLSLSTDRDANVLPVGNLVVRQNADGTVTQFDKVTGDTATIDASGKIVGQTKSLYTRLNDTANAVTGTGQSALGELGASLSATGQQLGLNTQGLIENFQAMQAAGERMRPETVNQQSTAFVNEIYQIASRPGVTAKEIAEAVVNASKNNPIGAVAVLGSELIQELPALLLPGGNVAKFLGSMALNVGESAGAQALQKIDELKVSNPTATPQELARLARQDAGIAALTTASLSLIPGANNALVRTLTEPFSEALEEGLIEYATSGDINAARGKAVLGAVIGGKTSAAINTGEQLASAAQAKLGVQLPSNTPIASITVTAPRDTTNVVSSGGVDLNLNEDIVGELPPTDLTDLINIPINVGSTSNTSPVVTEPVVARPVVPEPVVSVTQPVEQTPSVEPPSPPPIVEPTPPTSEVTGIVLQNNGDGTALVLTNDGNAANVPVTDAVSNEPLTPGSSVTIDQNTNTATVTPPASDVEEPVVQEPPSPPQPPPAVPTTPEEPITEPPQEPVVSVPPTEPPVTEPVVTKPVVTEPVVTEPPIAQPVITQPVVTTPPVLTPEQIAAQKLDAEILKILRMDAKKDPVDMRYDLNKDGRVNVIDALALQRGQVTVPTVEEYQASLAQQTVAPQPEIAESPITKPAVTGPVTQEPLTQDIVTTAPSTTPTVQDTGDQQILGGGQQPTKDAGLIIDTPIGKDTSTPAVTPGPDVNVNPNVNVDEPIPPVNELPPVDELPLVDEFPPVEDRLPPLPPPVKTEEDLLLEQIIRELEPTPPVSEGVPIPEPVFPEPPLVLPESPTINVGDRLAVRPVVDRGYRRPSVSPGSRVEESTQILPIRPGLSEGGTGGIEGTTEQEQEPVWNVRSLKLRRLLGI